MDTAVPVTITTGDPSTYGSIFSRISVPAGESHKGQNGKVLVIGGSSLFHGAVIWPAEVASHFTDMIHVASTEENNEIIRSIKVQWRNGIVISQKDLPEYVTEDDVVLLGNGLMRVDGKFKPVQQIQNLEDILKLPDEGERTYHLTRYLLLAYPDKKWVIDAGALQMMEPDWLVKLNVPAIITPHQKEFEKLFGIPISSMDEDRKVRIVVETAARFHTVILLKSGYDIVSDGRRCFIINGGNAGLTKGGTGDILAGIAAALYAKNAAVDAAVAASLLVKLTAEEVEKSLGLWFNNAELIAGLPKVMNSMMRHYNKSYGGIG